MAAYAPVLRTTNTVGRLMPVPTPIDGRPFLSLSPRGGPSLVPVRASVDPRHRDEVALVVVEDRAKAAWCSQPTDRDTSEEAQFHRPVQGEGQPCAFGYGLDVDRHAVAGAFIPACARSTHRPPRSSMQTLAMSSASPKMILVSPAGCWATASAAPRAWSPRSGYARCPVRGRTVLPRQPKTFYPLQDTDHLLTDRTAAEAALQVIRHWFDTTLRPLAGRIRQRTRCVSDRTQRPRPEVFRGPRVV
jgi:hypothetical protein